MSVVCADDHAGFRAQVRQMLAAAPGFKLVGEVSTAEAAINVVRDVRPDMLLIDVRMPGMGGFEAAERLAGERRDLVIVVMTAGSPQPPAGFAPRGGEVTIARKEQLSARALLDIWHSRRTRRALPSRGGAGGSLG